MIITPWDRRRATFGATLCSLLLLLTSCARTPQAFEAASRPVPAPARDSSKLFGFSIPPQALRHDGLLGLSSHRVAEILGKPSLRRRDWPADLWQYEAGGCVMDIVFYDDAPEEGVVHAEARLAEGSGLPGGKRLDDECLGRIQRQAGT